MTKRFSTKQKSLPPSKRSYPNHVKIPDGCVDVWRVNVINDFGHYLINSTWLSRDLCMKRADGIYENIRHGGHVYVEHKAAMKLGDKWHIVNITGFRLETQTEKLPVPQDDLPEAEFSVQP